jgi:alkanesulfonate monooxygenase SsuD/methylene tetrahydromethanopterin reductase-like flavin-dependent oxidoreductase (luciferase family)
LVSASGRQRFGETCGNATRQAAGFDSIWLGEHHNNPVLYPAPLIGLAAVASRTRRIRLGTGVLLLPLYHPMMVAEEGAMVDVISGGRLILGVGAGYAPEEFAAFGQSLKERGSRMEESASLLHRLWTETNVTHHGKNYRVDDATVAPRPVQQPRPPIWFGAWAKPACAAPPASGRLVRGPSANLDESHLRVCISLWRDGTKEIALFRWSSWQHEAIAVAGDASSSL